jgi:predicted ribosomally synthesized peptide with nif11-like leader
MSKENLIKLMQTAADDEQLLEQLQSTTTYEDVKNVAARQGLDLGDLSADEAQRTMGVITGQITEELSDEELELVAGGFNIGMPPTLNFNIGMPPWLKKGFSNIAASSGDGRL